MKLTDQYDWVVLGDHPGALLSAGLAARLGLSVLILPMSPGMGVRTSDSGQCLDPEPNCLIGLDWRDEPESGPTGLLARCISRMGVMPGETESIRPRDALPQVVTPGARIGIRLDDEELAGEFKRELGKDVLKRFGIVNALKRSEAEFNSFWSALPERLTLTPTQPRKQRGALNITALKRKVARERKSAIQGPTTSMAELAAALGRPELAEVCMGLCEAVNQVPGFDPGLADFLHLMALARRCGAFRGGVSGYRAFLLRLAARLGAHLPDDVDCRRVFIENGRFVGVQVSNRGNMIAARGAAAGCSLDHLAKRASYSGRGWFRRVKDSPQPVGWRFTLALTVHQEAIVPGLSRRSMWMENGAPGLELEVADPADYGRSEPDHRILFVRTVMPWTAESLKLGYQRHIAGRMFRQLNEIVPFLEFHVVRVYPDFMRADSEGPEGDLAKAYGFGSLTAVPGNLRCFGGQGLGSRAGIDGLFVVSDESFPELGSLGATVAAVESVAWLAHRAGLAGPLV